MNEVKPPRLRIQSPNIIPIIAQPGPPPYTLRSLGARSMLATDVFRAGEASFVYLHLPDIDGVPNSVTIEVAAYQSYTSPVGSGLSGYHKLEVGTSADIHLFVPISNPPVNGINFNGRNEFTISKGDTNGFALGFIMSDEIFDDDPAPTVIEITLLGCTVVSGKTFFVHYPFYLLPPAA